MNKALKIINRLESTTSDQKSDVRVSKNEEIIIFVTKENQLLIQLIHFMLLIGPILILIYQKNNQSLIEQIILILSSIIILLSYIKGSFQTDNRIEINIKTGEVEINRKSFFGKLFRKNKIVKTTKSNEIIKEDIPLSFRLDKRLTLLNNKEKIPLIDFRNNSTFDQIYLALNLLVKS